MAKEVELKVDEAPLDEWIERLGAVLQTVEKMGPDERHAAFRYMKDRYPKNWPNDSY